MYLPIVRRILAEILARRGVLGAHILLMAVASLSGITVPLLTRHLVDHGLVARDSSVVLVTTVAMVSLGLVNAGASAGGQMLGSVVAKRLIHALRMRLYEHLQTMPLAFFARSQSGALQSRITTDVVEAQSLIHTVFGMVATNTISLLVAVTAMFVLSPLLTLVVLATAPLLLIPLRRFGRQRRGIEREQATEHGRLNAYLTEWLNVGGAMLRLLFGHHRREAERFRERSTAQLNAVHERHATSNTITFLLASLGVVGNALVYLIGGFAAVRGSLTVGTVVAMAGLVRLAYDPLVNFTTHGMSAHAGMIAFERVYEVLDFPSPVADPERPVALTRPVETVEFRGVWFRHPEASESTLASLLGESEEPPRRTRTSALRGISLTARRGTTTAIVGPTGAGKTTLTALISRLYDPTRGAVLLDGVDLRELSLQDIRAAVGVVTQDAYLLNETLAANLRVARPEASEDELRVACERACLAELVARLPDGLDTVMGDRGYRLSGGERQRVALARVFLQDPEIVVLDEATAHLDSGTEQAVRAAIDDVLVGRTLIVVAHRLSTVIHADQILVLDAGEVVEHGTHAELLAAGSLYPKLYQAGLTGA